ncbi:MAG: PAS domain S-box protein [Methanomicrobia archaeon]|nr:PAS domain S-box protein [Methanomicrobia archaeon]
MNLVLKGKKMPQNKLKEYSERFEEKVEERTKELRESEEKFKRLFNSSPEAILYVDKDFETIDINPRFEELFSYSIDEIKGKEIDEFLVPKDRINEGQKLNEMSKKGYTFYETVRKKKDGTLVPVSLSVGPIISEGSIAGIIVIYKDITERKRAEEELQVQRNFAVQVMNTMGQGLTVVDTETRFEYVNPVYARMLGYSPEELIGKTPFDVTFPEDHVILTQAKTQRWKGKTSTYETRLKRADGGTVYVSITGVPRWRDNKIVGTIAVITDITERRKMEESLKESEERFRTIFETAQDSIFIKDCTLKYTKVNPAMEKLFGLSASKIIGRTDDELFDEEAASHLREIDSRVLGGEIVEEEHTKSVKGVPITFHIIKVPMCNSSGEIIGLCGIARDITERKKAEELLEKQSEELSAFAHTVSHDLKNYIGIIRNYAQLSLLKKKYAERNTQKIIDMTKKMEEFVTRQLQLADAGKAIGKLEEIDLNKLIDGVRKTYSIEIHTEELPKIKGDPQRLKEAFHNLIDNAIKHGGADRMELSSEKKKDTYIIYVKDNGKGISKEEIDKIFDMRYSKTGTGFGLSIVRKIIEAHGGSISVKFEEGKGTTFEIVFPF